MVDPVSKFVDTRPKKLEEVRSLALEHHGYGTRWRSQPQDLGVNLAAGRHWPLWFTFSTITPSIIARPKISP